MLKSAGSKACNDRARTIIVSTCAEQLIWADNLWIMCASCGAEIYIWDATVEIVNVMFMKHLFVFVLAINLSQLHVLDVVHLAILVHLLKSDTTATLKSRVINNSYV